jgi:hypothetical protein
MAVDRVDRRVRGYEDFRVDLTKAWFASSPAWLPEGEKAALREAASGSGALDLHGEGVPEAVAERLAADPRVERVVAARRAPPDAVEVLVELRRPVALVETGGRTAAVDREGRHLPGDYAAQPLPRIRGADDPVPAPGAPFGESVRAGAAVAAAVPGDLLLPLGLEGIDVGAVDEGGGVVLRRKADRAGPALAVEWGRAPGSPLADLDPPADSKVARLRLAAGRFPGLRGLRAVRLSYDDLVVLPR